MGKNFGENFSEEFRNTTVTISVQEMGEIIARRMVEICDPDVVGKNPDLEGIWKNPDLEGVLIRMIISDILRGFGASIMSDMFKDVDFGDKLEIEPNK